MIFIFVLCLATLAAAEAPVPSTSDVHKDSSGFSVQTGYEGYLVPSDHSATDSGLSGGIASLASSFLTGGDPVGTLALLLGGLDSNSDNAENHGANNEAGQKIQITGTHGKPVYIPLPLKHSKFSKLQALVPKKIAIAKFVSKLVVTIFVIAIIFLLTGGVAASVCAFTPLCSISFPFQEHVRSLVPAGVLNQATSFVLNAIERYQKIQNN